MRTFIEHSPAPAAAAWRLMARPALWHVWAPHVRGAWNLGHDEVREGALGVVRLLGAVPVPAAVVAKEPGRSWTWRVGPVEMTHRVASAPRGSRVAIDLRAPGPVEPALALAYGPVIRWSLRRLARSAARWR